MRLRVRFDDSVSALSGLVENGGLFASYDVGSGAHDDGFEFVLFRLGHAEFVQRLLKSSINAVHSWSVMSR